MPVVVETVHPKSTQIWKDFSGRIKAVDYVEIRPQVSGTITEIKFVDGARVNKGDILFVIDPRPYDAALRGAQASMQTAKDQLNLADKELVRAKELIKTNAISKRIYDERASARQVAASQLDAAQAAVEQAQINLDYAYVKAPVSGYTSRAEVTLGNLVDSVSAPILTSIVSDSGVYADFEVDEKTYLQNIRKDSGPDVASANVDVQIVISSLSERIYKGKIHAFDNRIDPASGTIRARAFFANEDKMLLPGMFVNVKMGSQADKKIILVSEKAIGTDQNRKFVMIADKGKAAYRPVTLGASSNGYREILSGLGEGDQVIIEGLMHIRPDMPVAPKEVEVSPVKEGDKQADTSAPPSSGDAVEQDVTP
jgi:membrane fusion protein, multidrug efflux system